MSRNRVSGLTCRRSGGSARKSSTGNRAAAVTTGSKVDRPARSTASRIHPPVRALTDQRGTLTIEIAEVWAVGARSDRDMYSEMTQRVTSLGDSPVRRSLSTVLDELGKSAKGFEATPPQQAPSRPETWLVDRLVHTAGRDRADVLALTSEQAVDAWPRTSPNNDDPHQPSRLRSRVPDAA